jgi:regulator of telomere elongation helicase 1
LDLGVPKIIYASRTHAQLSQAAKELKRSFYSTTKSVVLGSRDVMCINEGVSSLPTASAKIMGCHIKVKTRSCSYYNNVSSRKEEVSTLVLDKPVVDIEDLVTTGRRNSMCPFFMSRELVKDAHIVFMPYNYLMDPKLRSSHGVELKVYIQLLAFRIGTDSALF